MASIPVNRPGTLAGLVLVLVIGIINHGGAEEPVTVAELRTGDACIVDVSRGGIAKQFGGRVVLVSDSWLVCMHRAQHRNERSKSVLSNIPFFGRFFIEASAIDVEVYEWLPIGAATVREYRKQLEPDLASLSICAPPIGEPCLVDYRTDAGPEETSWLKLVGVSEDTVTLVDDETKQRREFAVDDVLGITIYSTIGRVRIKAATLPAQPLRLASAP